MDSDDSDDEMPLSARLGLVLAPIFEKSLRETLFLGDGDLTIFLTRPVSATILAFCALALLLCAAPQPERSNSRRMLEGFRGGQTA